MTKKLNFYHFDRGGLKFQWKHSLVEPVIKPSWKKYLVWNYENSRNLMPKTSISWKSVWIYIYLDVQKIFGHYCGSFIYGFSGSVENSTQHVFWNGRSQNVAGKFTGGFFGIDSGCSFKNLKCIRSLI